MFSNTERAAQVDVGEVEADVVATNSTGRRTCSWAEGSVINSVDEGNRLKMGSWKEQPCKRQTKPLKS